MPASNLHGVKTLSSTRYSGGAAAVLLLQPTGRRLQRITVACSLNLAVWALIGRTQYPPPPSSRRYGGKVAVRDKTRKTPWDYVHEKCPKNRELNKMMKEAFDREEKERAQVSSKARLSTTTFDTTSTKRACMKVRKAVHVQRLQHSSCFATVIVKISSRRSSPARPPFRPKMPPQRKPLRRRFNTRGFEPSRCKALETRSFRRQTSGVHEKAEFALIKEEEDHANAKTREANEARERGKTEKTASEYRKWRGGG